MELLPLPRHFNAQEGHFLFTYRHRITLETTCPEEVLHAAQLLVQTLEEQTGIRPSIDRRSPGMELPGVHLCMDSTAAPRLGTEGYLMQITQTGVDITGASPAGILYGVQTLRQIIRQSGCLLPCLTVEDYPELAARGLFYDVTRGRIPTMAFLKAMADRCSEYKLNQLHLYIEHTFLFDGFSEIWRDDTPLTAQDILELDQYCRRRHVDLVPSIATLGHLYKVLRSQSFRNLSELEEAPGTPFSFYQRMAHHTLDVTQDASLDLVYRMLDAYAPLFSSKLFNLNGDEPFDLGHGKSRLREPDASSHEMYVDWLVKLCEHVRQLGKQPMFWGDVILADPDTIHRLPADVICMNWDYDPAPREDHAKKLAATGVAQYLCPGVQGWKQTIARLDLAYGNIRKMAQLTHRYGGEGLLVTEWGDFGHLQDPESAVPGILYAAQMAWNPEIPSEDALNRAVSVLEYGDRSGQFCALLRRLSQQVVMNWGCLVEFSEISRGCIPEKSLQQFYRGIEPTVAAQLPHLQEINDCIDACQKEICALAPAMSQRKRILPYLIMSDGQKLINRFAAWIGDGIPEDTSGAWALASELETWYASYRALWHTSSRESELYRIGEVIFWAADYLRQLPNSPVFA